MTYKKLFELKYRQGISTQDLVRQYPKDINQVSEVALLEVPEIILREIIKEEDALRRLIRLKKRFANRLPKEER